MALTKGLLSAKGDTVTPGTEDKELLKTRHSSEALAIDNTVRFTYFLRANYGFSPPHFREILFSSP